MPGYYPAADANRVEKYRRSGDSMYSSTDMYNIKAPKPLAKAATKAQHAEKRATKQPPAMKDYAGFINKNIVKRRNGGE